MRNLRSLGHGWGKHTAIASLAPDLFCVSMNGLSKSHRIAGFRVGWMVLSGPKHHVKGYIEGLNMLSNMRLCSNVLSQHVVQTSLGGYQSVDKLFCFQVVESTNNGTSSTKLSMIFQASQLLSQKLVSISSLRLIGTCTAWMMMNNLFRILEARKILLVHGRGFNWKDPDHFRIVYLPRVDELAQIQKK